MASLLVTGANRGIGLEFARQYAADGWSVVATVRDAGSAGPLRELGHDVRVETLDLRDRPAVATFGERLEGAPLDLLIASAGMSGPEQIGSSDDADAWLETLAVNAVAPVLLAGSVAHNLIAARGKLVAITSRMGSISDNQSGGYIGYRASKAALNAAWKSLAIDLGDDGVVCAVFHPGWVRTRMGGPSAPLEPKDSVAALRALIDGLTPDQNGAFLDHDGSPIPW